MIKFHHYFVELGKLALSDEEAVAYMQNTIGESVTAAIAAAVG